ncbi:MAG: SGNH/GDSL hydrolase family protein [Chloroflexi bacterium]|nr:MAG: SGNH/GDSL hydrolase family protein [Chloroflexota bacterium]
MALGDSLAFGFQLNKFIANPDPSAFTTGYVDDFASMLQGIDPAIETVNLGCPDETTLSFKAGPCPYRAAGYGLHHDYAGAQMDAAISFLKAHPGEVSPITIDLGANDVNACRLDQTCIAHAIATVGENMGAILTALRAAAPSAEIIVMEFYNPYAFAVPGSNTSAELLNSVLASDAALARGRVADAFTPFNLASLEPGTLCALTFVCTPPLNDIHASDPGYLVIAEQFWAASGYGRLDG